MHTIISTVGTSLFTNANRTLGNTLKSDKDHYEECKIQLMDYLSKTNVIQASAETHALYWLGFNPSDKPNANDFHLIFLHSHTTEGQLCAEVLVKWYTQNYGVYSRNEVIRGLQSHNTTQFRDLGMVNLAKTLAGIIKQQHYYGYEVTINATGGFKPETAYSSIIGFLLGARVVYVHEVFRQLVELPSMPMRLSFKGQTKLIQRIQKVLSAPEQKTAQKLFDKLPETDKLYIERIKDVPNPECNHLHEFYLTVLGQIVMELDSKEFETTKLRRMDVTFFKGKTNTHKTLFGTGITRLSQVRDMVFCEGILKICNALNVTDFQLTKYSPQDGSNDFQASNFKKHNLGVTFNTYCPAGKQQVIVECEEDNVEKYILHLEQLFPTKN